MHTRHLIFNLITFFVFTSQTQTQAQSIIITEVMRDPTAVTDANGEWFEIYNNTHNPIDINGWKILDAGSNSKILDNGAPLIVPAHSYFTLGVNDDPASNGGISIDFDYGSSSSFSLANGADEIILKDRDGIIVDSIGWDNGELWPKNAGKSMSLINLNEDNSYSSAWCVSTTNYNTEDLGSPGEPNDCGTITSVEQVDLEVSFYPNPSQGELTFTTQQGIEQFMLYDLKGNLIHSILQPEQTIELPQMKTGMYLVKTVTMNNVIFDYLLIQ